eukprot:CAMPEP_0177673902 /NCGR_PEP_ID=MMETSP0447-20121125/26234_1 /TAXON_ID=0 /ORGANISM="Stygamoeba regulata, Strain BSH-02190019" /LENGTH=92 /DNA_ID=CAMNT_0019181891 /DNA_START=1 /DNA_END=276 /DNA_ORIENTATION=-
MTHLTLTKFLKVTEALIQQPAGPVWESPMLLFFARARDKVAFEEVYCQIFLLFDALWQHQAAGYMDFSTIITTIEREFDRLLSRLPLTIDQF